MYIHENHQQLTITVRGQQMLDVLDSAVGQVGLLSFKALLPLPWLIRHQCIGIAKILILKVVVEEEI